MLRRDLSTIRRYLSARFASIRAAANSEVELPGINLAPLFRVASALFAVVAIGVAGFTAWQIIPGKQKVDETAALIAVRDYHPPRQEPLPDKSPVLAVVRDHHPTLYSLPMDQPSPEVAIGPVDFEMQFVNLATAPEEDRASPAGWDVLLAQDVDAQDWYHSMAGVRPEEDLVATLDQTSHSRRHPNKPPRPPRLPAVSGIPIAPEQPGEAVQSQPLWLANAVISPRRGSGPMIAIVIDDAGIAQKRTARAIELPAPLTIAFIPYSNNLKKQTRKARRHGHELLLHMPMEPGRADADPGHQALLTSLSQDEIIQRFRWALDRFDGYVGVNNHMGSKFMARSDLVKPVLEEINERGLLFLDSRTDHRTVGAELAQSMGMPHATRNVFLDNEQDIEKIRAQLAELERVARRQGHAIGIGHPHDVTIEVLAEWLPEAHRKGFVLVPVSTIVKSEYALQLAAAGGEPDGFLGSTQ